MPKRRNLNGLPNNLVRSYFSTINYYKCGHIADWLVNAARILELTEATIDILNETIKPDELNKLLPLKSYLYYLRYLIKEDLKKNEFPSDFITEAIIKVEFLNQATNPHSIYCYPSLTDKEGHKYEPAELLNQCMTINSTLF